MFEQKKLKSKGLFKFSLLNLFVVFLTSLLVGCNGQESENTNIGSPSVSHPTLSTTNSYESIELDSADGTINLEDKVISSNGSEDFFISKMMQVGKDRAECAPTNISGKTFSVKTDVPASCDYFVYFKNKRDESGYEEQATVRVVVSDRNNEAPTQLSPLSVAVEKGQCETINVIEAYSGEADLSDYQLDNEIQLLGGGGEVSANATGINEIQFCGLEPSVNQVLFSLTSSDGLSKTAGVLSASVSTNMSTAPIADDFLGPVVVPGESVTVNVCESASISTETSEDCHVATENSDASLQLINVYSYDSISQVSDLTDVNNLSFNFSAENEGTYDVSYLISDHRGGYDVGVVRILVSSEPQVPTWTHIELFDGTIFSAPLTDLTAEQLGVTVEGTHYDNGFNVATYSLQGAKQLCENHGYNVPNGTQINNLLSEAGPVNATSSWPVGINYWLDLSDSGIEDGFSTALSENVAVLTPTDKSEKLYVTCVQPGIEFSVSSSTDTVALKQKVPVNVILKSGDGSGFEGEIVTLDVPNNDGNQTLEDMDGNESTESIEVVIDSEGNGEALIKSTVEGTYTIRASYQGESVETSITFEDKKVVALEIIGPDEMEVGTSQQYYGLKTFDDGTQLTTKYLMNWSTTSAFGSISTTGLVTANGVGIIVIKGAKDGVNASHRIETYRIGNDPLYATHPDGTMDPKVYYYDSSTATGVSTVDIFAKSDCGVISDINHLIIGYSSTDSLSFNEASQHASESGELSFLQKKDDDGYVDGSSYLRAVIEQGYIDPSSCLQSSMNSNYLHVEIKPL